MYWYSNEKLDFDHSSELKGYKIINWLYSFKKNYNG